MVKKQIVWTKTSIIEVENILQFYIKRNKNNIFSTRLLNEIAKRIDLISVFPKIGIKTDLPWIRILPFKNFGIIYKESNETIFIESIWDFRQNPIKRNQ